MALSYRVAGMLSLWIGVVLSVAALACTIAAASTGDDCDDALLVRARLDAVKPPGTVAVAADDRIAGADSDVASTLAKCVAAKSAPLTLPTLAGLFGLLALASFALALWIAKPWDRPDRAAYSGYRSRR